MNNKTLTSENFDHPILAYKGCKRLGTYLVEAQLMSPAQIEVALNDQQTTGYRLGDILVLRGWIERESIEWVVQNKLLPERNIIKRSGIDQILHINMLNSKDYELFESETVILKKPESAKGEDGSGDCL